MGGCAVRSGQGVGALHKTKIDTITSETCTNLGKLPQTLHVARVASVCSVVLIYVVFGLFILSHMLIRVGPSARWPANTPIENSTAPTNTSIQRKRH